MIDSEFMIAYTDALYATSQRYNPSFNEFRDMFSSGQLKSKEWLISELDKLNIKRKKILIAGAWYGTLGVMIKKKFPTANITMLDIDARCKRFVDNVIYNLENTRYITEDMYKHDYQEDIIINTSCEHIPDLLKWLITIPENKIVIMQSNNYFNCDGHVNCVNSIDEFIEKSTLTNILYSGELITNMYTRYMLIAKT